MIINIERTAQIPLFRIMPLYALCGFSVLFPYFMERAIVMSNSSFIFHFLY